jgi:Holliday junction resolvase RusA-like endonuclease
MRLLLPLPPSDNDIYELGLRFTKKGRPYRGIRSTNAARGYKTEVWALVRQQTTPEEREMSGRYSVIVRVRFPDDWRQHDAPNTLKALGDALKVALDHDDENFWKWTVERVTDGPACEVVIEALEDRGAE